MSNRLIGILIILGFIGAGYIYYTISYIPEQKLKIEQEIKRLEEENVVKKEIILVEQVIEKKELSNQEKIENIKEHNNNYKVIALENLNNAIFKEEDNFLGLYISDKKIGNFTLVYPQYIRTEIVSGTENDLYIEVGKDKFYYNTNLDYLSEIDLNIDVQYLKKGKLNNIIIVSTKGSFIFDMYKDSLDYFSYFNDFIYFDGGYIGLVKNTDKRIINNLGLNIPKESNIVYYNPETKEKKVLYSTNKDFIRIYNIGDRVFFNNSFYDLFELENLKQ